MSRKFLESSVGDVAAWEACGCSGCRFDVDLMSNQSYRGDDFDHRLLKGWMREKMENVRRPRCTGLAWGIMT